MTIKSAPVSNPHEHGHDSQNLSNQKGAHACEMALVANYMKITCGAVLMETHFAPNSPEQVTGNCYLWKLQELERGRLKVTYRPAV